MLIVDDCDETFQVLDTYYGYISTVLPDWEPSWISFLATRSGRKYLQLLDNCKKGIEERAVDLYFIQEYFENWLSNEIESFQSFIDKIKVFQRTNLEYLHTNKEVLKRTYQNQDRVGNLRQTGVPPNGSRNDGSGKNHRSEHASRSSKANVVRKPIQFLFVKSQMQASSVH